MLVPLLCLSVLSQGLDEEAFPHNYIPSCPLGVAGRRDRKSLELDSRKLLVLWAAGASWEGWLVVYLQHVLLK